MILKYDVLVVGGGIAGVKAAIEAKTSFPSGSVAIISQEPFIYRRAALTSVISGSIRSIRDLIIYTQKELKGLGIDFLGGYEALSIEPDERRVLVKRINTQKKFYMYYKKLILATGSLPALPLIAGNKRGVYTVKWLDEALSLSKNSVNGKEALVIGAGFIGLEAAEALKKRGMKVTIAVRSRMLRKIIEPDFSQFLKSNIEEKGVKILTGFSLTEIAGNKRVEYVKLNDRKISTSLLVFATGVVPNVKIAKRAGIKIGETGAIKVDNHMRTSVPEIYAAGDCAEINDTIINRPVYRPLGYIAAKTGEVAGANAVETEKVFMGSLRKQYDKIFDMNIISMGLSTNEALNYGMKAEALEVKMKHLKYNFFPIKMPLDARIKVIVDIDSGTLIGWQVIGRSRLYALHSLYMERVILDRQNLSALEELTYEMNGRDPEIFKYFL